LFLVWSYFSGRSIAAAIYAITPAPPAQPISTAQIRVCHVDVEILR